MFTSDKNLLIDSKKEIENDSTSQTCSRKNEEKMKKNEKTNEKGETSQPSVSKKSSLTY
jgi:hypothetical protein